MKHLYAVNAMLKWFKREDDGKDAYNIAKGFYNGLVVLKALYVLADIHI